MKTYPPDNLLITVSRWSKKRKPDGVRCFICDFGSCLQWADGTGYCPGHAFRWWNKWYRRLYRDIRPYVRYPQQQLKEKP